MAIGNHVVPEFTIIIIQNDVNFNIFILAT
ncbi:CLUMA_CG000989, isoform A [Clunio marinus]|uniref:CLUMA_CG000989, isoform A n=1 Tax=Clunio marinus TaxID=568069 RepID=A0A1J1HGQ6_9DIPT|nr:CLUMA_CG000989, isoform A [Clunio marinus]